ncbi:uncharacterized protein LOC129584338 [Paramacrobiotus metropolitanus]|uniref:uncharacterized protein LOC129584338 n=1 Tax=Paramacrobiotus metropolitanus TaxID=2943436 RepID=UPI002445FA5C|nr:uncharacterized protein LOC129584338 [Paramacrobiotus metropolitanus]
MTSQEGHLSAGADAGPRDVSSRSFCAGDVIMLCEPWVWGFDHKAYAQHCAHCFQEKEGLATCSGCHLHRYCSKACQASDWKREHKLECAMLKKLGGTMEMLGLSTGSNEFSGSQPFDLVAKIACKIKRNATMNLGDLGTVSAVDILRMFPTDAAALHRQESASHPISKVESFLSLSPSEFSEYYHIAGYNALAMFDILGTHHPFAHALYPQAPFRAMTPACWDVNVVLNFVGRRLVIHATQDIPNYTGLHDLRHNKLTRDAFLLPRMERRHVFQVLYGRPCNCRKCTKEYDAEINPLKCVTPECRQPIPSDSRALAPCPQCGAGNSDQLVKFMRFMEECQAVWQSGLCETDQLKENLKIHINMNAGTFLHPDAHIRYVYGFNRYKKYFEEGRFDDGWKIAQEMITCLKKVYSVYDITFAPLLATTAIHSMEALHKEILKTVPFAKPAEQERLKSVAAAACPIARSYCQDAEDIYTRVLGPDSAGAEVGRKLSAVVQQSICNIERALDADYSKPFVYACY